MGAAEALGGSIHDGLKDPVGVLIQLIVPDAHYRPTFLPQEVVAAAVTLRSCMLATVELDDESGLPAGEIGEVRTDRQLAGKFRT